MEGVSGVVFTSCSTLVVCEILYFLTPEDSVVKCVYGLIYSVIILTCIYSFAGVDFGAIVQENMEVDNSYVKSIYLTESEKALCKNIEDALVAASINDVKVEALLAADENNSVSISKINVLVKNSSDLPRAKIIIEGLFPDMTNVEVYTSDG